VGSVDAYHIFFVEKPTAEGGVEITSLLSSSPDFKQPKVKIDSQLMQFKGLNSLCFYVVADAAGSMSEPSDTVCTTVAALTGVSE
jgi:hypothetical protein